MHALELPNTQFHKFSDDGAMFYRSLSIFDIIIFPKSILTKHKKLKKNSLKVKLKIFAQTKQKNVSHFIYGGTMEKGEGRT